MCVDGNYGSGMYSGTASGGASAMSTQVRGDMQSNSKAVKADRSSSWRCYKCGKEGHIKRVRPGSIDPMTAVVQRVKGFAYYSLSFSRHNKNIKMEQFFLYILSRYFI